MYDQDTSERSRSPAGDDATWTDRGQDESTAREKVSEVATTAKQQASTVAGEVRTQAGRVAADVRGQVTDQARQRQQQLAERVRSAGDELRAMAADREQSPARTAVEQLAGRSEQV